MNTGQRKGGSKEGKWEGECRRIGIEYGRKNCNKGGTVNRRIKLIKTGKQEGRREVRRQKPARKKKALI